MKRINHFYTNKIILDALVESCLCFEPKLFKPYLLSESVKTDMPDKKILYNFFKKMVFKAKENSEGSLILKIENPDWIIDKTKKYYNFYDSKHIHSRLSILIKESEEEIYFDVMPF